MLNWDFIKKIRKILNCLKLNSKLFGFVNKSRVCFNYYWLYLEKKFKEI